MTASILVELKNVDIYKLLKLILYIPCREKFTHMVIYPSEGCDKYQVWAAKLTKSIIDR